VADKWNPLAKPSDDLSADEFMRWMHKDVERFWRQRMGSETASFTALKKREQNRVFREWYKAREAAELEDAKKLGPEWYRTVKRFQRTRTIVLTPSKSKSPAKTKTARQKSA
jgi:hypothetical protein